MAATKPTLAQRERLPRAAKAAPNYVGSTNIAAVTTVKKTSTAKTKANISKPRDTKPKGTTTSAGVKKRAPPAPKGPAKKSVCAPKDPAKKKKVALTVKKGSPIKKDVKEKKKAPASAVAKKSKAETKKGDEGKGAADGKEKAKEIEAEGLVERAQESVAGVVEAVKEVFSGKREKSPMKSSPMKITMSPKKTNA
ncbi:hypothetical protein LTR50_001471 [Elasticomyces elasticus]|nr:hypothetical protein LTR50_001471 [Elasticomyces elasticus]